MSLTIRKPWTSQPQIPVGIDCGNSITQGLVFATEASFGGRDIVSQTTNNPLGSGVTVGQGINGKQWDCTGSQADRANNFGVWQGLSGATKATWDITIYFSAANPTTHFFCQWDNQQQWLLQASAGSLIWVAADDNVGNRRRRDLSGAFPTAGWYRVTGSWLGGAVLYLVINGVDKTGSLSAVSDAANNIGTNNTADFLQIGMCSGGIALAGAVSGARIWNRGLSLAECLSLNSNANQIYAPLRRTIPSAQIAVTIARPGSDITTTGWTGVPNNTNKYANIDETSADDSDYINSPPVTGTVAPIIFGIVDQNGGVNTLPVGTWDVHVRATYIDGLTASQVRVTLLDSGGTSVGASSWQTVTSSFATYTLSITTTGIAARIKVEVQ